MKRIFILLAAIVLLCVQNAGAWGFQASYYGGSDSNFPTETFYTDGYSTTTSIDVYTMTTNATMTWFAVNQNSGMNGDGYGFSEFSYGAGAVVRATAFWNGSTIESKYTVILPDGKVFVTPAGGSAVEMRKVSDYVYTAVTNRAATISISGSETGWVRTDYYGNASSAGAPQAPAYTQLSVTDVPVTATSGKIKVTYNLRTNQVTSENLLSEYCDWAYTSDAVAGNKNVLFTWETLANGNVVISIAPGSGTAVATFRGNNGLAPADFKVNGVSNSSGNTFFLCSLNSAKTQITLVPQQTIPDGAQITHNALMEWITTGNGNEYTWNAPFTMPYTYGSNCSGIYVNKLATPANVSIDNDNVLTFNEVANATEYIVTIKFGSTTLKTFNVSGSGETVDFPFSGAFEVTVVASDNTSNYANSDPSVPYVWNYVADDQNAGFSPVCEVQFGDVAWGVTISIETATEASGSIQPGDIIFTLAGNGAGFRAQGARLANITVGGVAGANVLTKVSGNLDNPNVFRPISGITIAKGTPVVYNGEFEILSAANSNIWGGRIFNYIYGTGCTAPQLDPPADLALDASNSLTFTPDANAASTTIYIMLGDEVLYTIANFTSGSVINFPINGSFTIKGRSITGSSAFLNSELSDGISLVIDIADAEVGTSEYCEWTFNPTGPGSAEISAANPSDDPDSDIALLTWETTNGNIVITLKGTEENSSTTAFRDPAGFNVSNLTIGGIPALNLVTPTYGANQVTFAPIAGISIPKGTVIGYSGMVLYRVLPLNTPNTELDNLWPSATFSYTYGAVCDEPLIFDASSNGADAVGKWRLVSAPLASWTGNDFSFELLPRVVTRTLSSNATTTVTWVAADAQFGYAQGDAFMYQVSSADVNGSANANWNDGKIIFTSPVLADETFTKSITSGQSVKYTLLGNPYLVPLPFASLTAGSNADIIVPAGYYVVNADGKTYTAHDNDENIPVWSGLIVQNLNGGDLTFTKPIPVSPAPSLAGSVQMEKIIITAYNDAGSTRTFVKRSESGQSTVGKYDLAFINAAAVEYPQIYSLKGNVALGINTINITDEDVIVPLGIIANY
ncbi:MAG: hypothetical protein FWF72_04320, partial [Paludibacter sp.]|nr:hypothetical protein [Paludibacter sp.]